MCYFPKTESILVSKLHAWFVTYLKVCAENLPNIHALTSLGTVKICYITNKHLVSVHFSSREMPCDDHVLQLHC